MRCTSLAAARPDVRNEIAEHATADRETVQRVDHPADVAATQVGCAILVRYERVAAAAEIGAAALHARDVDATAAVPECDGVVVDHAHVARAIMRQATDRPL